MSNMSLPCFASRLHTHPHNIHLASGAPASKPAQGQQPHHVHLKLHSNKHMNT